MKKEQWVSLVRQRASTPDKTIDLRVASAACSAAYIALINELSRRNIVELDAYSRQYKSIAISTDSDGSKYSIIPAKIVPISNPQEGIREISTSTGTGLEFVPISNNNLRLVQDLDVNLVDEIVGYTLVQNSDGNWIVEYNGIPDAITSVKMRIVIAFDEYLDSQEILIPSGTDNKFKFLDLALNYLIGMQPKDKLNNNTEIPPK